MSDENENYADSSGRYDSEGFAWYPYDQMPNALTWGIPGGHTEKIFVGQIPYGFIALDLARLTSYLSGTDVTEAMAVVMYKDDGRSTGSGFVHVPRYVAAILWTFSKRVLCDNDGVWVSQDAETMQKWFAENRRGGRGAMVFEASHPRSARVTPAPEELYVEADSVDVYLPVPLPDDRRVNVLDGRMWRHEPYGGEPPISAP